MSTDPIELQKQNEKKFQEQKLQNDIAFSDQLFDEANEIRALSDFIDKKMKEVEDKEEADRDEAYQEKLKEIQNENQRLIANQIQKISADNCYEGNMLIAMMELVTKQIEKIDKQLETIYKSWGGKTWSEGYSQQLDKLEVNVKSHLSNELKLDDKTRFTPEELKRNQKILDQHSEEFLKLVKQSEEDGPNQMKVVMALTQFGRKAFADLKKEYANHVPPIEFPKFQIKDFVRFAEKNYNENLSVMINLFLKSKQLEQEKENLAESRRDLAQTHSQISTSGSSLENTSRTPNYEPDKGSLQLYPNATNTYVISMGICADFNKKLGKESWNAKETENHVSFLKDGKELFKFDKNNKTLIAKGDCDSETMKAILKAHQGLYGDKSIIITADKSNLAKWQQASDELGVAITVKPAERKYFILKQKEAVLSSPAQEQKEQLEQKQRGPSMGTP